MINEETRAAIKGYLEGFIQGLIEQHRSGIRRAMVREAHAVNSSSRGILKPFHEAIIPPEILRISTFERSFSTKLGTTFEECARLIALQTYAVAEREAIELAAECLPLRLQESRKSSLASTRVRRPTSQP